MSVTIALADDHEVVRQGLRTLLEGEADFRVAGEASNGADAVALVERTRPDVLLVDLMMPGMNGLDVIRLVRQGSPQTRVIVASMHADESYVSEALRLGAVAYVLKQSPACAMVEAVRKAVAGQRYLSPPLSEANLHDYRARSQATPLDLYETLTERESQVLLWSADSLTSAAIAQRLAVSTRTVEQHRAALLRKLGVTSQAELIRYAFRRGLLPLQP